jgi:hypothetical protein
VISPAVLLLFALASGPPRRAELPPAQRTAVLTRADLVAIDPGEETTLDEFMRDWGQFEVRVPKGRFPIRAPRCRRNVILRMPAASPRKAEWRERIESRWRLFQSILEVKAGKVAQLEVELAAGPYQTRDEQGEVVLQYCNAFFKEPSASPAAGITGSNEVPASSSTGKGTSCAADDPKKR